MKKPILRAITIFNMMAYYTILFYASLDGRFTFYFVISLLTYLYYHYFTNTYIIIRVLQYEGWLTVRIMDRMNLIIILIYLFYIVVVYIITFT